MKFTAEEYEDLTLLNPKLNPQLSLEKSYEFCENIAKSHYENFPVASLLIPQTKRKYFYSIYAFSRIADDISDELISYSSDQKIELLQSFLKNLKSTLFGAESTNPIIKSLNDCMLINKIKFELFERLIKAFIWDIHRENGIESYQAKTYKDLLDYCHNSADPIGELVLTLFNENNADKIELSNKICTALQLINFWQDLSLDLKNNRNFIPREVLKGYNISIVCNDNGFSIEDTNNNVDSMLDELYNFTESMMFEGMYLVKKIDNFRLRLEIAITIESGMKILQKIRNCKNIFEVRPKLIKFDLIGIGVNTLFQQKIYLR